MTALPADPAQNRSFRRRLGWILAAGLLLRLVAVFRVPTQPVSDFWAYYQKGLNLARHAKYEAIPGRPDATHPPLYPILLAGAFLAAPAHPLAEAKLVNCFLGLAAALAGAILARRLGGDQAGHLAAAFFAFLPRYLLMPCLIASENLFAPLLLLFLWLVLEGAGSPRAGRLAAGAGGVVALAALTRTVAHYLGAVWLLGALAARKKWRTALGETVLLLAIQHAVMLPWALRNQAALGRFTFLNTAGGYGLFLGNNPNATGLWYDGRQDLEKAAPGALSQGEVAVSDASNRAAWRWMRENPGRALRLYLVKFGIIFRQSNIVGGFAVTGTGISPPWPPADVLPWPNILKTRHRAMEIALSLAAWLIVLLGAAGCLLLARRALRTREPADLAAALVFPAAALYVPVMSALIAVNGRYRWPVEDVLVPVAALFCASVLARRRTGG